MNDERAQAAAPMHVVLGAGQIGTQLADELLRRGHRVRIVRRGAPGPARGGLEWARGDIRDPAFADEVGRGAAVVYDCMNPLYHQWPELLLPLGRGALRAAQASGAKLVALDCLYMYGRPSGPIREDSPLAPVSKKGRLRVELAEARLDAHRRGDARVAIARASDFFGPDITLSVWGERAWQRVHAGNAIECFGDPDMPHAYTYGPDVVRALATLGARDEALGKVWLVPTAPAESTRALASRFERALGRPVPVKRVPRLALRALGLFSPMMRALAEMAYQWDLPYAIDDTQFRRVFGVEATPVDQAVATTAAWIRARFAPKPGETRAPARAV